MFEIEVISEEETEPVTLTEVKDFCRLDSDSSDNDTVLELLIASCREKLEGYLNVYSPFARLYHYEGSTRGYETPLEDARIGYERLEPYLINEDPYFSPNLTNSRIPKCITRLQSEDDRKQRIATRKKYYLKK